MYDLYLNVYERSSGHAPISDVFVKSNETNERKEGRKGMETARHTFLFLGFSLRGEG